MAFHVFGRGLGAERLEQPHPQLSFSKAIMNAILIFILSINPCLASPVPEAQNLVRFDRVGGPFSNEFVSVSLKAYPGVVTTTSKALAPNEAWQVNMKCPGIDRQLCDRALVGLKDAGRLIAESLQVTRIITMNATFRSFGSSQKNVLGRATYGSSFVVKKQSGYYTMGQALLKQHMTDVMVPMSDVDIVAEFNADYNWYFKDSGMDIQGKQDFTYVVNLINKRHYMK